MNSESLKRNQKTRKEIRSFDICKNENIVDAMFLSLHFCGWFSEMSFKRLLQAGASPKKNGDRRESPWSIRLTSSTHVPLLPLDLLWEICHCLPVRGVTFASMRQFEF